jgi:type I restriction enzyme S subunit
MAKPKLRFPEFMDEWKEYRISEIFKRVANPVTVEKDKYYKQIGIRSHGKGLFYKEEVTGKELGNKRVFWVEPDCFVVNIVFAWERAVAKLTEAERGMIASHRFPMYKPKDQVLDLDYITEYFTTLYGQKILMLSSPGGAGRNKTLGQDEFSKSRIKLPSFTEQRKISNFLFLVDDLIQIQEEEISALEEQKKGLMQKLFNHEVRFKADDGSEYPEWEEKRIDEVCQIVGGGTPSTSNAEFWNGNIQWFTPTEVGKSKYVYTSERTITEKGIQESSAKLLPKGSILLSTRATIGEMSIAGQECCTNQGFQSLIVSEDCSNEYIYYLQYIIKAYALKNSSGSTFLEISKNNLGKCILPIPCIKEQEKIVGCLSTYDEAIQIKKDKLEVWKEIKKGFLQQMFV